MAHRGISQCGLVGTNTDRSAEKSLLFSSPCHLPHSLIKCCPSLSAPSRSLFFLSPPHASAHKPCLWEMASVFQLACNGPLTRLASGELGPQQMLLWMGCSSAACRLYWIVIRVELTIHDGEVALCGRGRYNTQAFTAVQEGDPD